MKLPYRKLLVWTGVLIVTILATFLGSTVRLFQTIGWLPVHPIPGLDIAPWMGTWLGIYPSWEGMSIPLLGFAYVGGAWLWVRWSGRRQQLRDEASAATSTDFLSRPPETRKEPVPDHSFPTHPTTDK
jgi:high-affinity iron transporter